MDAITKAIRYCKDIGMFALDFPRSSCIHRTSFCNKNCYNIKLHKLYGDAMAIRDQANFTAWETCTVDEFVNCLNRKHKQIKRFRFATRGETFYNLASFFKVRNIALAMPDTIFWVPTRAWRDPMLKIYIENILMPMKNVRVMASLDPSNTPTEIEKLKRNGWSTIYFGDNDDTADRVLCEKTWTHGKNICPTCENGCFNTNRVDVHLKRH